MVNLHNGVITKKLYHEIFRQIDEIRKKKQTNPKQGNPVSDRQT